MAKKKKYNIDKELDELWSEAVKKRAGYKCEYCSKETYLNSHHIYSRSNYIVRWELANGVCLCSGHHTLIASFSAHKNPIEFYYWLLGERGAGEMASLRAMSIAPYFKKAKDKKLYKEQMLRYLKINLLFRD